MLYTGLKVFFFLRWAGRVLFSQSTSPALQLTCNPSSLIMAAEEADQVISVKAWVDKAKNRVVFVESDHDFVDLLLSFLTLPMGTIIRSTRNHHNDGNLSSSSVAEIGCMNNLYRSVENLDPSDLKTEECKKMLLYPRRSSEVICKNLKLKIDDSEPTKFYYCDHHSSSNREMLSYSSRLSCHCDPVWTEIAYLKEKEFDDVGGVFVKGEKVKYLISDDLQVKSMSMGTCMLMLRLRGINDWSEIEERNVDFGIDKVLDLLKRSLISNTPLTDVILYNGDLLDSVKIEPREMNILQKVKEEMSFIGGKNVTVKLLLSKSCEKEVFYAKVKEDFLDLVFSFLAFPLGSIVKLCGGSSSIVCMDNLYKSVQELSTQNHLKSVELKTMLLNPKLATHFGCENQPLYVEEDHPRYNVRYSGGDRFVTKSNSSTEDVNDLYKVMNPKCVYPSAAGGGGGFIKGPSTFMVTNDLVVTPLSFASGLSLLKSLDVPFSDVEERIVSLGEYEALNLLKATLMCNKALGAILTPASPKFVDKSQNAEIKGRKRPLE